MDANDTDRASKWRTLDEVVAKIKAANAGIPQEEIDAAIDEALAYVRARRFKARSARTAVQIKEGKAFETTRCRAVLRQNLLAL